jgi:hypothetical protein
MVTRMQTRWYTYQLWQITGANQLRVFGDRYLVPAFALLAVWIWMALDRARGARKSSPFTALSIVTGAAVFVIPNVVWIPPYAHQLAFISERVSLLVGVLVCAALAGAAVRVWQSAALAAVAALFFAFLYTDEKKLNGFEDQLDRVVAQLPPGQRVVLSVNDPSAQVNALTHMIDRACIGRCWSYANYEASSGQFRVRVAGNTTIVTPSEKDSSLMESGQYVVKADDPPLAQVRADASGRLTVRAARAGDTLGLTAWNGL